MTLKAVPIKRDPDGHWKHPGLPDWSDDTPSHEMEAWAMRNNLESQVMSIGQRIKTKVIDQWLAGNTSHPDAQALQKTTQGYFVAAVSKSEDQVFLWLLKPSQTEQGVSADEVHSAA